MDRQRNDRLGRTGRFRQQFKHRRQILRAICFANAYSDCNSNSDCNRNATFSNPYFDANAQSHTDSKSCPNTTPSRHPGTAPVTSANEKQTQC